MTYGKYFFLQNVVSRYFCAGFRIRISEKLRRLPVSFVDKTPAGDVIDRMMDDVGNMADSIYIIVDILLSGFLQMTVIAVILFLTDWRMAIPVVLLSPLSILLSTKMATLGEKHWDKHWDLGGKLTALAEEAFTNYPTTKAFCGEGIMQERYDALSKRHQHSRILGDFLSSIVQPVIATVNALAYIVVTVVGINVTLYVSTDPSGETGMTLVPAAEGLENPVQLRKETDWTFTWDKLPSHDEDGNALYYFVEEDPVPGYTPSYINNGITGGTIVIQNDCEPYVLPSTGGIGTGRFVGFGVVIMAAVTCVYIIIKKRKMEDVL